jgi:2-polyprenyl-3-methyl-5-hydroxy-6-metoxy-1,4-benzoquinol methylase
MERIPCPLCDSPRSRHLWTKGEADYVQCSECTLVYENPRLTETELKDFYSAETYFVNREGGKDAPGYQDYFQQCSPALVQEYFSILQSHAAKKPSVRFLDLGCGPGGLLAEAKKHGWNASGLEISRWAVEKGRAEGLDIVEGTLQDAHFAEGEFDLISMFDVLEHLPHPRDTVSAIARVLRPGGVLVIETPNIEGFFVRTLYGAASDMVKPRAHICLYSPTTARRLLKGAGLSVVRTGLFPWCRRITPGYVRSLILSRVRGGESVQLTWNESMRIVATR